MKNIDSIKNIRCDFRNKNITIKTLPGIYRWWFKEEGAMMILNQLPHVDMNMIQKRKINDKTHFALYFGISKDLKGRIKWHTCQHHTTSSVKSGYLSTLRQTLSAFLNTDMSKSESILNEFIEENCYWEWDYTNTHQDAINKEKKELASSTYYYPLNISDNKSAPKEIICCVKDLRKKYNK